MKKTSFIDGIRVKDTCTQAWDEMLGNDKVRFCTHCAKDVNNISAMTRKEARRLVRRSGGTLCIRYVEEAATKAPTFTQPFTQITRRRVPLMAAGVMGASLSLATLTYAQGGAEPRPPADSPAIAQVNECEDAAIAGTKKAELPNAVLRGTVVDIQGAVVPNVALTLFDAGGKSIENLRTDSEGSFRFERVPGGRYALQTEAAGGFKANRTENIAVTDSAETAIDITLSVDESVQLMGVVAAGPEFEGALAIAVSKDDINEARSLISHGENVNGKEGDGTTPLFIAVENGNVEMVELLLDAGARVNARNERRETPLMSLDGDASPELVETLLRHGAKVNQVDRNGNAVLIHAARIVTPEVLKSLVEAGADLDAQNTEGLTALMEAADADNLENARVLVLAGANVNLKDKKGYSTWHSTTAGSEVEKLLEAYGAIGEDDDAASTEQEP